WPTAATFLRLALLRRVPLTEGMAGFLGGLPPALSSGGWAPPSAAAALLEHLRGGTTIVELARRIGVNRVSVARWLKGNAEPRLPVFLLRIEATSLRVLDFVALFASPAELPAASAAWQVLEAQRRVAY